MSLGMWKPEEARRTSNRSRLRPEGRADQRTGMAGGRAGRNGCIQRGRLAAQRARGNPARMTPAERRDLIARYVRGPEVLRAALARVPREALQWRPAPGKWSVHEVVCHCA